MADKFLQIMAFSATVNYEDNKEQAALAASLCEKVLEVVSRPEYDSLNVLGWTLREDMLRWAQRPVMRPR